jgi:hypothetical protein
MMYALQLYVTQRLVHQACYRLVELCLVHRIHSVEQTARQHRAVVTVLHACIEYVSVHLSVGIS